MNVYEYTGPTGCGKSTLAVGDYFRLLEMSSYIPEETIGNLYVDLKGYTFVDDERLVWEMERGFERKALHRIYIIDDASNVFPARGYSDKRQSKILRNIWLNRKLFTYYFVTDHLGRTVDLILDEAVDFMIIPRFKEGKPELGIPFDVYFINDVWLESGVAMNPEKIWERFESYQPAGVGGLHV